MSAAELQAQRRITKAYIDANPVEITLTPHTRVRTATGGFSQGDGVPRDPQIMRLIDQSAPTGSHTTSPPSNNNSGTDRRVEFMLLGEWDSAMAVGDTWDDDSDITWELIDLLPDNGYERRAMVVRHG